MKFKDMINSIQLGTVILLLLFIKVDAKGNVCQKPQYYNTDKYKVMVIIPEKLKKHIDDCTLYHLKEAKKDLLNILDKEEI